MIAVASTPVDLPANTIAVVSEVPRKVGTITKAEFHHGLVQAAAQAGRKPVPKPGGNGYGKLKELTIGDLLDVVWIKGQAAEMGIVVTSRKVSRALARLKKHAFKSEADYRRFLKKGRLTRRDVRERVEVQLLSTAIQQKVTSEESATQEAFSDFAEAYTERWRARTVCAPEYMVATRCSNAAPATPE